MKISEEFVTLFIHFDSRQSKKSYLGNFQMANYSPLCVFCPYLLEFYRIPRHSSKQTDK